MSLRSTAVIQSFVLIGVEFETNQISRISELPAGWNSLPPTTASQAAGDHWLQEATSLALEVPSVVVPGEFNYLLNPAHPDFRNLVIGDAEDFQIDPRLRLA